MKAVILNGKRPFFAAKDVTCYVLRGVQGDLLIDTGLPYTFRAMQKWLAQFDIRYVLLTHAHPDHDWNAAALQKQGAKILLGRRDYTLRQNFFAQPQTASLPRYRLRTAVQAIGAAFVKSPRYVPDNLVSGGSDILRRLGFDADIIALPGHTLGSVGVLQGQVLYCGDAFTMLGGKPALPMNVYSRVLMRHSLRRIRSIRPKWIACGHGLPVRFSDVEREIAAGIQNEY